MKNTILILFLACMMHVGARAQNLTVVLRDGSGTVSSLSSIGRIELSGLQYRIMEKSSGNLLEEGDLAGLQRFSFVEEALKPQTPTSVRKLEAEGESCAGKAKPQAIKTVKGGRVVIVRDGKMYDLSGRKLQ